MIDTLLPPNEDAVRAAAERLGNTEKARRMWAVYDGYLWAPDLERIWLHETVAAALNGRRLVDEGDWRQHEVDRADAHMLEVGP